MKKKLRLLLTKKCNRNCEGCCNKNWDLDLLESESDYKPYSLIMLTGGEPMLDVFKIFNIIDEIREQTTSPIILYTAKSDNERELLSVLHFLDGMTLTLHEQSDVENFVKLNEIILRNPISFKTDNLRLNVFSNVDISSIETHQWKVKENIEWIKDCPLPIDEVFRKYKEK